MKKIAKAVAAVCAVVAVSGSALGLVGCADDSKYNAQRLNELANDLALSLIGNDAYTWNVFSASPEQSFGYERRYEPTWYSYSATTESDVDQLVYVLNIYNKEFKKFNPKNFDGADAVTYRALEYTLDTYLDYYRSKYAVDFSLIGGSYISAEGGYVADFANACENYAFRDRSDVDDLLAIAESTDEAFETYADYASDRQKAGYPLYDSTLTAMCDYLNDVAEKGDDYYLYGLMDRKLDAAAFLTAADKAEYKVKYRLALKNSFMRGVSELKTELESYKGSVAATEKSYLASYGAIGKAYYEWQFKQYTGLSGNDLYKLYYELADAYVEYADGVSAVIDEMEELKDAEPEVYADFYAYVKQNKALLGITEPQAALDYIKRASSAIVSELETMPEIEFKYMDDTVARISNNVAYYLKSPVDDPNATESITINDYYLQSNPSELLTTLAHEGYPGHLYSYVKTKEAGIGLLPATSSGIAFSEGWAKYTELKLLEYIKAESTDKAVKAYCDYQYYYTLSGFINMCLLDLQVNYFGYGVSDYVDNGIDRESAVMQIESIMERPVIYIPYGYGMYYQLSLHNRAQNALGDRYSETEFNDLLLSEGFAPTLERASEITDLYIARN